MGGEAYLETELVIAGGGKDFKRNSWLTRRKLVAIKALTTDLT